MFAQTSTPRPHSRASGDYRRLAVLRAIAAAREPASRGEIMRRTGMPYRTVSYYLSKLVQAGLVEKVGGPPYTLYKLSERGRAALGLPVMVSGNGADPPAPGFSRVGCAQLLDVCSGLCFGGWFLGVVSGAGLPGVVGARLVWQRMGDWHGELGVRVDWRVYRRLLGLFGVSAPRGRVKRLMKYVAGRVVHDDAVVAARFLGELGLHVLAQRELLFLPVALSILKTVGVPLEVVAAMYVLAPLLDVEGVEAEKGEREGVQLLDKFI